MKRYTKETIPNSATYMGSSEGPNQISSQLDDLIDDSIDPAYIQDNDGTRHYFELFVWN